MKNSLIIISFFAAGIIIARFTFLPEVLDIDFSEYALYLLMFLVGISVGSDKGSWRVISKVGLKIFLVPASVIAGSLIGVFLVSFSINDLSIKECLAIGSGFGYYSLSSVIIDNLCGEIPGVIALLSNISREIITLVLAPFFARYFGKLAPIASGGATSMDTTLPIIARYSGKEFVLISIFSGTVLTIIVPFLVTFILSF